MAPRYVIWQYGRVANACHLDQLQGVTQIFQLKNGISRNANFPQHAAFTMNADYPHDTLLIDSLFNTYSMIVASKQLKDFLEMKGAQKIEYLPVTILDHKKKPVGEDYFIIHPTDPIDCLELEKCEATRSPIVSDNISELKRLVIDESKIDPGRKMFRVKYYYRVILVRRDLAEAIAHEGFTGIKWGEMTDYLK